MKKSYVTRRGDRDVVVEVEPLGESRYAVTVDGVVREVDAVRVGPATLSLLVDGRSADAVFETSGDGVRVLLEGDVFAFDLLDERRRRLAAAKGRFEHAAGPTWALSPMPGKLVRVLVKTGDAVKEGQGLCVVEAMKMENELKAVRAGTVKEVRGVEGQPVDGGAKLVLVE